MIIKCDICNKIFHTSQHLKQHKNRKKPCKKNTDDISDVENKNNNTHIKHNNIDISDIDKNIHFIPYIDKSTHPGVDKSTHPDVDKNTHFIPDPDVDKNTYSIPNFDNHNLNILDTILSSQYKSNSDLRSVINIYIFNK
jgi:hypothetical protein